MNVFRIPVYAIIINVNEDKREQIRQLIGYLEFNPDNKTDNAKQKYSLSVENWLMSQSVEYYKTLNRDYINEELDKELK